MMLKWWRNSALMLLLWNCNFRCYSNQSANFDISGTNTPVFPNLKDVSSKRFCQETSVPVKSCNLGTNSWSFFRAVSEICNSSLTQKRQHLSVYLLEQYCLSFGAQTWSDYMNSKMALLARRKVCYDLWKFLLKSIYPSDLNESPIRKSYGYLWMLLPAVQTFGWRCVPVGVMRFNNGWSQEVKK